MVKYIIKMNEIKMAAYNKIVEIIKIKDCKNETLRVIDFNEGEYYKYKGYRKEGEYE